MYLVVIVPPEDVNGNSPIDDLKDAIEKVMAEAGISVQIEVVT